MSRYYIEKVYVGFADSGISGVDVIVTVQFKKDGESSQWLSNADCGGFCTFYQNDFNPFDILVSGDIENPQFGVGMIDSFEGVEFDDYEDIFDYYVDNKDDSAVALLRYIIALTRSAKDEVDELILLAEGKYIDEIEVPISDLEEDYLDSL